jgi:hypothetical protein
MSITTAQEIFSDAIPGRLKAKPELQGQINARYKFVLTGDGGGTWLLDLTQPGGAIGQGDGEAACTLTIPAEVLIDIVNGKSKAMMAFATGKLKVAGNAGLAAKLLPLLG